MEKKEVVGKALKGPGARAKHVHPVVLTGTFKKEEEREPEHKKGREKEEFTEDSRRHMPGGTYRGTYPRYTRRSKAR